MGGVSRSTPAADDRPGWLFSAAVAAAAALASAVLSLLIAYNRLGQDVVHKADIPGLVKEHSTYTEDAKVITLRLDQNVQEIHDLKAAIADVQKSLALVAASQKVTADQQTEVVRTVSELLGRAREKR